MVRNLKISEKGEFYVDSLEGEPGYTIHDFGVFHTDLKTSHCYFSGTEDDCNKEARELNDFFYSNKITNN